MYFINNIFIRLGGGQAFAEEGSRGESLKNYVLDEYVVTATKTENKIFDANANISVITKADIEL